MSAPVSINTACFRRIGLAGRQGCSGRSLRRRYYMQQKKETNHTEVLSIEEYLTKRKRVRDMDQSQMRGGIPKENQALVLAGLCI